MKKFSLSVDGIERREYYEACRESARRLYGLLAAAMLVICGAILLLKRSLGPADLIGPVVIYVLVMGGYELMTRLGYKDQLAVIDPPVIYDFNGGRWAVTTAGGTVEVEWKATARLRKTRSCLFLYNDDASSNLLPLRLMTEEQVSALETWYKNSRAAAKEYRKREEKLQREKFRAEHPGLRFGRTGPVWGPWKRKR